MKTLAEEQVILTGKWKPDPLRKFTPFWGVSKGIPHQFMWEDGNIISSSDRHAKSDGVYFPDLYYAYQWCKAVN